MPQNTIIPGFYNAAAAPDAQEHSCKTNPIMQNKPNFGRSAKTPAADRAKQSQFSRQTCKTNQIFAAVPGGTGPQGYGTRDKYAKRTQFPAVPGGAGPQRPGTWDKYAKRSQFAPDRPKGTRARSFHRVECAKRSQFQPPGQDLRADCVKQTQFGQAGKWPDRRRARMCETNLIWAGGWVLARPNVQNEPNFAERTGRGRSCETNQIGHGGQGPSETKPITARWVTRWIWNPPPYTGHTSWFWPPIFCLTREAKCIVCQSE
jgi:hypothetical protein